MANQTEAIDISADIADKIFELTEQFNQYVFEHPELLDEIPDKAVLVFLDADDPVFNEANIRLANSSPGHADNPRIYIKMQKRVRMVERIDWQPEVLSTPQYRTPISFVMRLASLPPQAKLARTNFIMPGYPRARSAPQCVE